MDFNLKQWRYQRQQDESDPQPQQPSAKLPRLLLQPHQQQQSDPSLVSSTALPFFVPELTSTKLTDLSAPFPPDHSTTTRLPKMGGGYFSLAQWQELELQALIYRHMLAGVAVPPELLHLVKKSLLNTSSPLSPYYLHPPLQPYSHCHPALLQSGYWGRAAMDPEPGRCRRTDGKKWRCSRDVVAGQKYCERHMHRGRNRSRKPVEIPTSSTVGGGGLGFGGGGDGGVLKPSIPLSSHAPTGMATGSHFSLSGHSPSIDLLHLNHRPQESRTENKGLFETQNDVARDGKSGDRVLRHFFDDWPRSLEEQEQDHAQSNGSPVVSSTCLSMSTPGSARPTSDFSLKLSTGNGAGDPGGLLDGSSERARIQLNWAASWGTSQVAPMGGPLAEALRSSSTSNSSPTSVLHQLPRSLTSETSYVST
ncbi:growth-regulating factor 3-like [Diospyros lotus]|uniref:growth-regulating factor 3-like n=1 Tax=Diospyros lotus TaxID=55363 RepID=UPI00225680A3|nr:growth-regulating factor 3-like [Diospyros lotus]